MDEELSFLVRELIRLGKVAIEQSGVCKSQEPYVNLTWRNDGTIEGEFYSYCLDLRDGGRHHTFKADDDADLVNILKRFIKEAKEELRDRESADRMENEGG